MKIAAAGVMIATGAVGVGIMVDALGTGAILAAGTTAATAACADGNCTNEAHTVARALSTLDQAMPKVQQTAFEVARGGGRHAGFLRTYAQRSAGEIAKAADALTSRADEHLTRLADPARYAERWAEMGTRERQGLLAYWQKEALTYREQADVLLELLRNMGEQQP